MESEELLDFDTINVPFKTASFGQRWGAILIDYHIIFSMLTVIIMILGQINFESDLFSLIVDPLISPMGSFVVLIGIPLTVIICQAFFESSKYQGTPGKIAVGIKVVNQSGHKVSFLQALGRNFGKIISGSIMYIGYFMAIWTKEKQTLHDKMANTYVVIRV